jgi:hypothetical protein
MSAPALTSARIGIALPCKRGHMQGSAAMGIARIQVGAGSGELLDFLHVAPAMRAA